MDRRGVRVRRHRSADVGGGTHRAHQPRHRHHADAGPHAGDDVDDRGHARPAHRRAIQARTRRLRPAGRRGLARSGLRQAARAHPRVRRHRADDPASRGTPRAPRRALRHPVLGPGCQRTRQAAQDDPAPARADIPIYLAAIGPKNVKLAAEIADGFLPIFWAPSRWQVAFGESLEGVDFTKFDVAAAGAATSRYIDDVRWRRPRLGNGRSTSSSSPRPAARTRWRCSPNAGRPMTRRRSRTTRSCSCRAWSSTGSASTSCCPSTREGWTVARMPAVDRHPAPDRCLRVALGRRDRRPGGDHRGRRARPDAVHRRQPALPERRPRPDCRHRRAPARHPLTHRTPNPSPGHVRMFRAGAPVRRRAGPPVATHPSRSAGR